MYNGFHGYTNIKDGNFMIFAKCLTETHLLVIDAKSGELKYKQEIPSKLNELDAVFEKDGNFIYLSEADVELNGTIMTFSYYDIEKRQSKNLKTINLYLDRFIKTKFMIKEENYFIFEGEFEDNYSKDHRLFVMDNIYNITNPSNTMLDLEMEIRTTSQYLYSMYPGAEVGKMELNNGKFPSYFVFKDQKKMAEDNYKCPVIPDQYGYVYFGLKMKYLFEKEHLYIMKYSEDGDDVWKLRLEETNDDVEGFNYFLNNGNLIVGADLSSYSIYYAIDTNSGKIKWKKKSEEHDKTCSEIQSFLVGGIQYASSLCGSKLHLIELETGKIVQNLVFESHSTVFGPFFDDEGVITCSVYQGNTKCRKTKYEFQKSQYK